eukprot:5542723-Alexandrium_andersonii.AAC.1
MRERALVPDRRARCNNRREPSARSKRDWAIKTGAARTRPGGARRKRPQPSRAVHRPRVGRCVSSGCKLCT